MVHVLHAGSNGKGARETIRVIATLRFLSCKRKKLALQVHDWVVYRLGGILGSVGHKVKIHKITPATGKERGDLGDKKLCGLTKTS